MNYTWPSDEQMASFVNTFDESQEVCLLNLLRFREVADYEGFPNETPCSGSVAFERYEEQVIPCIESHGGRHVYSGFSGPSVIGPKAEVWDKVILIEYPNAQTMVEMLSSERYQAIVHHRSAATEDSRLIPISVVPKQ